MQDMTLFSRLTRTFMIITVSLKKSFNIHDILNLNIMFYGNYIKGRTPSVQLDRQRLE